jgi:hypothetical protein
MVGCGFLLERATVYVKKYSEHLHISEKCFIFAKQTN